VKGFVLFLCVVAALLVFIGGCGMISIRSQAGNTIMEAYYNWMGWALVGLSIFLFAIGLGVAHVMGTSEKNKASFVAAPEPEKEEKTEEKAKTVEETHSGDKDGHALPISNQEQEQKSAKKDQAGSENPIPARFFACPVCGGKLGSELAGRNFCPYCGANLKSWGIKELRQDDKK